MEATKTKNIKIESEKTAIANLRHLKIAPRKVGLIIGLIRNMNVNDAEAQLMFNSKRASEPILKLLKSGIANAKEKGMDENKLVIDKAYVNQGPVLKRWIARAMGRATPINKRTSHITLVLKESEKSVKSTRFVTKIEKKEKSKKEESKAKKAPKQDFVEEKDLAEEINIAKGKNEPKKTENTSKVGAKNPVKKFFRRKSV